MHNHNNLLFACVYCCLFSPVPLLPGLKRGVRNRDKDVQTKALGFRTYHGSVTVCRSCKKSTSSDFHPEQIYWDWDWALNPISFRWMIKYLSPLCFQLVQDLMSTDLGNAVRLLWEILSFCRLRLINIMFLCFYFYLHCIILRIHAICHHYIYLHVHGANTHQTQMQAKSAARRVLTCFRRKAGKLTSGRTLNFHVPLRVVVLGTRSKANTLNLGAKNLKMGSRPMQSVRL